MPGGLLWVGISQSPAVHDVVWHVNLGMGHFLLADLEEAEGTEIQSHRAKREMVLKQVGE